MAEACGSRIHPLSESKGVTRRCNPSKTTRRNTSERLLPTDCPRVSFTRFSSPAAPFEPPCYSLSTMLLEPPVCRCSRLSEYQRDGVAPAAPSQESLCSSSAFSLRPLCQSRLRVESSQTGSSSRNRSTASQRARSPEVRGTLPPRTWCGTVPPQSAVRDGIAFESVSLAPATSSRIPSHEPASWD